MHINRIPKHTPPLLQMMSDISATPKDVAKAMRVHETTVKRWLKNDSAPWPVLVAIYWNTPIGHSEIDQNATNRTQELVYRYQFYKGKVKELERKLYEKGKVIGEIKPNYNNVIKFKQFNITHRDKKVK